MRFRSINEQPNRYNNTNATFKREGDRVVVTTNKNNIREIEVNYDIEDLIGVDDVKIRFIVRLGEELYTSVGLIDDLIQAREENNPYFTLDYITIVDINENLIEDTIQILGDRESRVNVSMLKTLDTPEDIIKQIDWATRSIPIDGSERSRAELVGQWSINGFPDQIFDVDNSVTVKDIDPPETTNGDDDDDEEDKNGTTDEIDDDDDIEDTRLDPREPRREQPRNGGGGDQPGVTDDPQLDIS